MNYNVGYFGDNRLKKNGELICRSMAEKQTVCLRQLGGHRSGEVKISRWFANESVTQGELIENITNKVKQLARGRQVLAIQDTTEINYQAHKNKIKGLGTVGNGKDIGFFMHPMLVIDAESGACLGLAAIKLWNRTQAACKDYHKQPIEEKESYRWIETAHYAKEILAETSQITIIADRESDIYEEWIRIPDEKTHLLTRACRDRKLTNGDFLFNHVNSLKSEGCYQIEVKKRTDKRSSHVAKLEIRFGEIEINKPIKCTDKKAPTSIKLRVIDVKEVEESVIDGEEPIHWCLLSTHHITRLEEALEIVGFYCQRWNIEQLFRTLKKQGLDIESSQMESAEGVMKLGILALYAALQTMQLTLAREGKDQLISVVFSEREIRFLLAVCTSLEGKTDKQKNANPPEKLSWASWIIARLGGWKGYQSESPPGPITIFKGLKQFNTLYQGYLLAGI